MMSQEKDRLEEEAISLYSSVYQYALAKVKERDVAQEIAQTVMEVVIRKRHTLKHPEALKKWVKVITNNKIKDHFRRLKRERERYVWEEDRTLITEIQDEEADILEHLQKQEEVRDVLTALLKLDEKYQTVLKLHLIYEKSISEIAGECNQSYHTIKTRYRRGMILLREACCKKE
ncbi:RNA polymerase sigma factor [bacterium 210820-DFI.6.37]|nr:RNA polymerase sigma factor [bacterium 210820-DFI.6.37]